MALKQLLLVVDELKNKWHKTHISSPVQFAIMKRNIDTLTQQLEHMNSKWSSNTLVQPLYFHSNKEQLLHCLHQYQVSDTPRQPLPLPGNSNNDINVEKSSTTPLHKSKEALLPIREPEVSLPPHISQGVPVVQVKSDNNGDADEATIPKFANDLEGDGISFGRLRRLNVAPIDQTESYWAAVPFQASSNDLRHFKQ